MCVIRLIVLTKGRSLSLGRRTRLYAAMWLEVVILETISLCDY